MINERPAAMATMSLECVEFCTATNATFVASFRHWSVIKLCFAESDFLLRGFVCIVEPKMFHG